MKLMPYFLYTMVLMIIIGQLLPIKLSSVALAAFQFIPFVIAVLLTIAAGHYPRFKTFARADIALVLLIVIVSVLSHYPHIIQQFYRDDIGLIIDKISPDRHAFTENFGRVYHFAPFIMLFQLFGNNPLPYTLTGIALHTINACLVYSLLRILAKNRSISFATAVIWVVAPAYLESFNWLAEGVGSGSVIFITMICLIFFAVIIKQRKQSKSDIALASAWTAVALNAGFVRIPNLAILVVLLPWLLSRNQNNHARNYLPVVLVGLTVTVVIVLKNFIFTAVALNNRPIGVDLFLTGLSEIGAALMPPDVQQYLLKKFASVQDYQLNPPHALTILVIIELLIPLVMIPFIKNKDSKKLVLFGWLWCFLALIFISIRASNINDFDQKYRQLFRNAVAPGSRHIQFAYIGYLLGLVVIFKELVGYITPLFRKSKWVPSVLFVVLIYVVVAMFTNKTLYYHRRFNQDYSIPLKRLITIVNQHAAKEPLLIVTPDGTPLGRDEHQVVTALKIISDQKNLYFTNTTENVNELIQKHGIERKRAVIVNYNSTTGEVREQSFNQD